MIDSPRLYIIKYIIQIEMLVLLTYICTIVKVMKNNFIFYNEKE